MYEIPCCFKTLLLYGDCPCSEPPTISGNSQITVIVGQEFDPLDGVTAVDCQGNEVTVMIEE